MPQFFLALGIKNKTLNMAHKTRSCWPSYRQLVPCSLHSPPSSSTGLHLVPQKLHAVFCYKAFGHANPSIWSPNYWPFNLSDLSLFISSSMKSFFLFVFWTLQSRSGPTVTHPNPAVCVFPSNNFSLSIHLVISFH